jgi:hypothetical protein
MSLLKKKLSKKVGSFFAKKKDFENYLFVLKKYWEKDTKAVLDLLTKKIETSQSSGVSLLYYRLWIEQLAELRDKASLSLLKTHLLKISSFSTNQTEWQALRGLIHLELDEMNFCSHLFTLLEKKLDSSYVVEFCEKYRRRFCEDGKEIIFFSQYKKPIYDYFHFKTWSESFLLVGDFKSLETVLDYVEKSYAKSPMKKEFSFYKSLDEKNYLESKKQIEALLLNYKNRNDYQFLYAYTLSRLGAWGSSSNVLEKILTPKTTKEDPDIYSLLAYNSYMSSFGDIHSVHWQKAMNFFWKTEGILSREGLSTKDPLLNLSLMFRHEKKLKKDNSGVRENFSYWYLNLKSSSFGRLMNAEKDEIFYLHEKMGASAREGDLVFFGSKESSSGEPRLGAVYQVLSSPLWGHERGYETTLELVARFDRSLNISKDFSVNSTYLFQNAKKVLRRASEKGCYLLSEKGLETLSKDLFRELEDKNITAILQALQLKVV